MNEDVQIKNALSVITQACSSFKGTLQDHQQIQSALKLVTDTLLTKLECDKPKTNKSEVVVEK